MYDEYVVEYVVKYDEKVLAYAKYVSRDPASSLEEFCYTDQVSFFSIFFFHNFQILNILGEGC